MKVLITGADGFIGSHLVERCLAQGWDVRAFVYYNSFGRYGWLDSLPAATLKSIEIVEGDIRDALRVRSACEGVDMIFHLAALISIPYSYLSPQSYIETNVIGTFNVLEAAKERAIQKLLVTSTSEVYGTAQYTPIDEIHPKQPQSPYAASKVSADALAESYFCSFDLPVTIVRPFNTYGPRQSARAIIPTIIMQLLSGMDTLRLGSLTPERDFLFVKDTAQAFIDIALQQATSGQHINIATGQAVSIGELAKTLIELIRPEVKIQTDENRVRPEKSEVMKLLGCAKKLKKLSGFKAKFSLKEGLKETIDWFKHAENLKGYDAQRYYV